jgi:YhcH/YjgK/YiaL family protein
MILDIIENLDRYNQIPHVPEIIEFINNNELHDLAEGDIPILGDDLYVKVLRYIPQESSKGFFETHEQYADLQFVIKGKESMFYTSCENLTTTDKFKMEGDFKFYEAFENISKLIVPEGKFTIFLPGEPHKPGCLYLNNNTEVMKLVFKIKIS